MKFSDITYTDWTLIRRHCTILADGESSGFTLSCGESVGVQRAGDGETFELLLNGVAYPEAEWAPAALTEEEDDGREWPDTDEEPGLDDLARLSDRIDRDLSHGYISNTSVDDLAYLGGLLRARIEELQHKGSEA